MKNLYKLVLIIFVCCGFANQIFANTSLEPKKQNPYYPTQADMLNFASDSIEASDKNFERICNQIVQNFKADKNFVVAFNADKAEFLKYRLLQRDMILPAKKTDLTLYGSNYQVHSDSYLKELSTNKIRDYKRMVELYCLYNDFSQPQNACSDKQIQKLFK